MTARVDYFFFIHKWGTDRVKLRFIGFPWISDTGVPAQAIAAMSHIAPPPTSFIGNLKIAGWCKFFYGSR